MIRRKLLLTLASISITACAAPSTDAAAPPAHDEAADRAAIDAVRTGYMDGMKAGDAAKVSSLMTADANDMGNGMPTTMGAAAEKQGLEQMFGQMTINDFVITSAGLDISGDLAVDHGTYKTVATPKAGGAATTEEGRYMVVLKRQADNSWKLVNMINNLPTGAAMPGMPATPLAKKP
jgi:uncharacterized protein (TIGR02246 family)